MSISVVQYLEALKDGKVDFEDTMAVISENYSFTPCSFRNGSGDRMVSNATGQNEGSLKIFSFAYLNRLDKEQTLQCFGRFYQDVLDTPEAKNHKNIRSFMISGWDGIKFSSRVLQLK
ncbi:MAG: HopJ type III effector protein [Pseudomonadales bacterium]|nr:HopJ type III effector protein [Pseudomonadales bacterium]NRA18719.1 HopJ type III effector protein [Oceanospirillaceae bacterium]